MLDPARYPRTYTPSLFWHAFLLLACGGTLAGGLFGAGYFGTGHGDETPTAGLTLAAVCLALGAAGLAGVLEMLRSRVTLAASWIEVRNLRTRRVARADIVEYRIVVKQGFTEYRLRVRDRRRDVKILKIFKADADFTAWFADLKNSDHAAREIERLALELDDRLGATPELRRDAIGRARKTAAWLSAAAFALGIWTFVYPRPYALAVSLTAALPLIAIWLCWQSGGLYALTDRRHSARGDLVVLMLMPAIVLAVRGLRDVVLAVPMAPLALSVGVGVVLAVLAVAACSELRGSPGRAVLNALFCTAWAYGVLMIANTGLDRAPASRQLATVIGARHTNGKGATAYFTLSTVPADLRSQEVAVGFGLFNRHRVGDTVCIGERPGALGWHWIQVGDAADCAMK